VIAVVQQYLPELLPVLVTNAPRWLIESYLPGDFIHRPRALDIGVIQSDSLTTDKVATLTKLRHIQAQANSLIAAEADFIQQNRISLVLADIPPLAIQIAQAAGVPCWMISNFGWDFIYRAWGGEFSEIANQIAESYSVCDRLFRLPFHEPMSAFPNVVDVGLTGGSPRYSLADLHTQFDLWADPERTIMLTFGGLGLNQIPYENLQHFPDWQFLAFDRQAPVLPNLIPITDTLYRPVDLMPLCGRVISKPGYSTFAEACRVGTPVVSLMREEFAEAPFLLEGLRHSSPHQILTQEEFCNSNWEFLHQPLQSPLEYKPIATDGNEAIARAVIDFFSKVG